MSIISKLCCTSSVRRKAQRRRAPVDPNESIDRGYFSGNHKKQTWCCFKKTAVFKSVIDEQPSLVSQVQKTPSLDDLINKLKEILESPVGNIEKYQPLIEALYRRISSIKLEVYQHDIDSYIESNYENLSCLYQCRDAIKQLKESLLGLFTSVVNKEDCIQTNLALLCKKEEELGKRFNVLGPQTLKSEFISNKIQCFLSIQDIEREINLVSHAIESYDARKISEREMTGLNKTGLNKERIFDADIYIRCLQQEKNELETSKKRLEALHVLLDISTYLKNKNSVLEHRVALCIQTKYRAYIAKKRVQRLQQTQLKNPAANINGLVNMRNGSPSINEAKLVVHNGSREVRRSLEGVFNGVVGDSNDAKGLANQEIYTSVQADLCKGSQSVASLKEGFISDTLSVKQSSFKEAIKPWLRPTLTLSDSEAKNEGLKALAIIRARLDGVHHK